jgi:periplasmic protein TonB
MNHEDRAEVLDGQIDAMLNGDPESSTSDDLLEIAAELRLLPSAQFGQALKLDLLERVESLEAKSVQHLPTPDRLPFEDYQASPTFSQRQFTAMPADPRSLLLSFMSHVAVVALIASGIWVGQKTVAKSRIAVSELTYIPLPAGTDAPHGGGSGGDHSTFQASHGTPPKFSEEQLAPPAIVVRTDNAKLQVEPTVLGPPELKLPQSNQLGDLLSPNVVIPSNGTGKTGGMGDTSGTGVGKGDGGGVGLGTIAGLGGEVFRPGNGVSAPRAIYDPDPEYSEEARRAKFQGNVVLSLIVDPTGRVRDIHVARSVGMGLDEKAIEAVRKWRFTPGVRDGRTVAVQVNVEVNFRLY